MQLRLRSQRAGPSEIWQFKRSLCPRHWLLSRWTFFCPANTLPKHLRIHELFAKRQGYDWYVSNVFKGMCSMSFLVPVAFWMLEVCDGLNIRLVLYIAVIPYYHMSSVLAHGFRFQGESDLPEVVRWALATFPSPEKIRIAVCRKEVGEWRTFLGTKKHEWNRYRLTQITTIGDDKLQNDVAYMPCIIIVVGLPLGTQDLLEFVTGSDLAFISGTALRIYYPNMIYFRNIEK